MWQWLTCLPGRYLSPRWQHSSLSPGRWPWQSLALVAHFDMGSRERHQCRSAKEAVPVESGAFFLWMAGAEEEGTEWECASIAVGSFEKGWWDRPMHREK